MASRVRQGLPGGVVAWCVGDSGGVERGLSCCRWLHGWCLGLTCTRGLQTLKYKAMKQEQTKFLHGKGPPIYENKRAWVKIVDEQTNKNPPAPLSTTCSQLWCICRQQAGAFMDKQLLINSSFPSCLKPFYQSEAWYTTIQMSVVCMWNHFHFHMKEVGIKTLALRKKLSNSEMAYLVQSMKRPPFQQIHYLTCRPNFSVVCFIADFA